MPGFSIHNEDRVWRGLHWCWSLNREVVWWWKCVMVEIPSEMGMRLTVVDTDPGDSRCLSWDNFCSQQASISPATLWSHCRFSTIYISQDITAPKLLKALNSQFNSGNSYIKMFVFYIIGTIVLINTFSLDVCTMPIRTHNTSQLCQFIDKDQVRELSAKLLRELSAKLCCPSWREEPWR